MGFISTKFNKRFENSSGTARNVHDVVQAGRGQWDRLFGATNKEDQNQFPAVRPSNYRSVLSEPAAFKRLLQAMRSLAPGGWSDDRWEQACRHFTGITYAAIHRTGELMAQSEFEVYQRDDNHPDGRIPIKRHHPGYDLNKLLEKPNNDDSFGDLLYIWNQNMDLTGMALTWMVPNVLGTPYELYPIPTAIAIPQPAINPDYPDGYWRIQPIYPYGPFSSYPTPSTAVGAPIPAQWMLRFKYPHPILRYDGYSPLTALNLHLDSITQIDQSRWYMMKRGIDPSAVLQFENMEGAQPLPEEEINRIHAEYENDFQGPENVGKLYVATPGARLEPWGGRPADMEYQAGWSQLVDFVLGAGFGITKPAAGMVEDASYSTLFATLKQLHLLTMGPKVSRISAQLTRHLAPFFGDDLIVEIKCQRIDDHDLRNSDIQILMNAKAITKNEIRRKLDYPLVKEKWGEEIAGFEAPPEQPGMGGMPGGAGEGLGALLGGAAGGKGGPPGGMPGEEGMAEENPEEEGGLGPPPAPPNLGGNEENLEEEALPEPREVTRERPKNNLGKGSRNPRKSKNLGRTEIGYLKKLLKTSKSEGDLIKNGENKMIKNDLIDKDDPIDVSTTHLSNGKSISFTSLDLDNKTPSTINVVVNPPSVTVNVPNQKPSVTINNQMPKQNLPKIIVGKPKININVPEQQPLKPPIINVNLPEQKSSKSSKTIIRDLYGRISQVVDE